MSLVRFISSHFMTLLVHQTITEVFQEYGEENFRKFETVALNTVSSHLRQVIIYPVHMNNG